MLSKLLTKFLGLLVIIRYGKLPASIRYYYRDTYLCQARQLRYLLKDYVFKPRYKVVEFSGEFAPELQFALPFAYWHYKNGTLKSTRSAKYTKEMYFFSKDHQEVFDSRTNEGNYNYELSRILYSQNYDMKKWEPVPLKAEYANDIYLYNKPILIVANRYNMEWDGPPISFLSKEMISYIISGLSEKYTIIYNRPRPSNITMDNSDIYDLDEYDWLKENYPEVILMEDLFEENRGGAKNFNHLQMMVYANASGFISIHGGTATLASYFGGINLILSKQGPEHHFHCYEKLYPKFSGAEIYHAKTDDMLKHYIVEKL